MSKRFLLVAVWMGFLSASFVEATTLTFDELPFQPVDGLSFMGVTFDFKVGGLDSVDANYNSGGPGSITFVQDPSLEGDAAGVLTLDFAVPTSVLSFGYALSVGAPLPAGVSVTLFDSGLGIIGVFDVPASPLVSFAEGQFVYGGGVAVSRAVLDFDEASALRFAFDNLTFGAAAVPEPSLFVLVAVGLAGVAAARRRLR